MVNDLPLSTLIFLPCVALLFVPFIDELFVRHLDLQVHLRFVLVVHQVVGFITAGTKRRC